MNKSKKGTGTAELWRWLVPFLVCNIALEYDNIAIKNNKKGVDFYGIGNRVSKSDDGDSLYQLDCP